MEIFGREIRFLRTVGATCEIEQVCPGKDISRFGELFDEKTFSGQMLPMASFLAAMSKGYEDYHAITEPGYKGRPLTKEEALVLDDQTFIALVQEAAAAFRSDAETTVTAEPVPAKNVEAAGQEGQ